jgi:hypothetical protein
MMMQMENTTDETELTATELLAKLVAGVPVALADGPGTGTVRADVRVSVRPSWPAPPASSRHLTLSAS